MKQTKRELIGEVPFNPEVEQIVLGRMIDRPELLDSVFSNLVETDFLTPKHKLLFAAIKKLSLSGADVTETSVNTVFNSLGGTVDPKGLEFIVSLAANSDHIRSDKENAKILIANSIYRFLLTTGMEIAAAATSKNYLDVDSVILEANKRLSEATDRRLLKTKLKYVHELVPTILKEVFAAKEKGISPERGLRTGIAAIDDGINGLMPGRVTVLAGATSMGKSSLAVFFGLRTAIVENTPVGLISLEMPARELTQRMISTISRVPFKKIQEASFNQDEYLRLVNCTSVFENTLIAIDDTGGIKISEMRSLAKKLVREKGIKLLIIDYLQLVSHKVKSDNSNQRVADISQAAKRIALEENIHVLLLSQLSRNPSRRVDPTPQLSDLRDSGSIEQDADTVVFIHRPARAGDDHYDDRFVKIIIAKNRSGALFEVDLDFEGEIFNFIEQKEDF